MATKGDFVSALVLLGFCTLASGTERLENVLSDQWTTAYNRGDLKALTEIYAVDARMQNGYCAPVTGRQAIEDFWRQDVGGGQSSTSLHIADSFTLDNVAYISGTYTVTEGDSEGQVAGRYAQIWRLDDQAQWRLYRELWMNLSCVDIRAPSGRDDHRGDRSAVSVSYGANGAGAEPTWWDAI